ncbi:hypothetical protein Ocin01_19048 [Orchesella cincta]|uniref:Uncharacterized protein n=1 Tax=Orchesella cincta TaxID=48709 RepID=A0A1D2M3X0_ORCCI|nr:hypothetical protein Ocin01_19048 [Orchesella cincta]
MESLKLRKFEEFWCSEETCLQNIIGQQQFWYRLTNSQDIEEEIPADPGGDDSD